MTQITYECLDLKPIEISHKIDGEVQTKIFQMIYEKCEINEDFNKFEYYSQNDDQDHAENSNNKTTKILTHCTNDEFLRYLDNEFKSEINLINDDIQATFVSKPSETVKSEDLPINNVKLDYRGHKHMFSKGRYAERRDVLYKSFIRATRRYLWEMFEKDFDVSLMPYCKPSELYQQNVKKYYETHFKQYADPSISESAEKEEYICILLGIILTKSYSYPNKTEKFRRLISSFHSVYQKFSIPAYARFFKIEYVCELFEIMKSAGVIDNMIQAYPKLSESKDSYLRIYESIVDFKKSNELLK